MGNRLLKGNNSYSKPVVVREPSEEEDYRPAPKHRKVRLFDGKTENML